MLFRVLPWSVVGLMAAVEASAGVVAAPLPIAGAAGPLGLAVAVVGYGAYRVFAKRRDK